jgi:hypothetical protein
VSLDERPRGSTRPTPKVHYNSLPRTSIEGALGVSSPTPRPNPSPQSSLKARIEKHCPVCEHPEKPVADRALGVDQSSPRSIKRRYCDLSRKALARHRDVCLASSRAEDAA